MANDSKPAVGADDILPMKKASSTALMVGGVGAIVVVGLLVFALSGGEPAPAKKIQATERAADAQQGMTKAELEERQAHLKKTQQALVAAAADEADPEPKPAPAAAPAQAAPEQSAPASKPAKTPSSAPAKKSGAASKKSMEGLDALGEDIASALK
jgi:hypothetical protein